MESREAWDGRLPDIVCLSHLRWDFVWQRPQQILARLAPQHRIAFIEFTLARVCGGSFASHRRTIVAAQRAHRPHRSGKCSHCRIGSMLTATMANTTIQGSTRENRRLQFVAARPPG